MELTRLTRGELLRLVNGTELGPVLTAGQLRRQIESAGARFLDAGGRIHFLKYVRWLAGQPRKTAGAAPEAAARYVESRRLQAQRNRAATKAAQDIGPIPDVADWDRREAACASLRTFCETYFSAAFCWPWCEDHLRAIGILEDVAAHGGQFAFAMFRGAGKTTLARAAALWMLLSNRLAYVCGIAGTQDRAEKQLLEPIQSAILENAALGADFPEALHALRALENSSKRQLQQHCRGQLTHVRWQRDRIVFPTIRAQELPASFADAGRTPAAQGAVWSVVGLEAEIRGQQHQRPDGTVIRPSLAILDDPQTRKSARSAVQTDGRMELIQGDVRYLAGPAETIAMVALVTVTYQGDLADRLLDRDVCPDWQSQRARFLASFPANLRLWEEYWELRRGRGQAGVRESNGFYRRHRADMDAGAGVAWEHAYDRRTELSALQHAMDLHLAGPAAFAAEYQNDPQAEQLRDDLLRPADVAAKLNHRPRGEVPAAAAHVTAFVDVHDDLLYWMVCAWGLDFTGSVVDYGVFPEQSRRWFLQGAAGNATLGRQYRGRSTDAAIQAGLTELTARLLRRDLPRAGGGLIRVGRLLVDMGYKPEIVEAVKRQVGGESLLLAKGVGIRAAQRPMSEYQRKPGEQHGVHWYMPAIRGTREFRHVAVDTNYWKSFAHAALAAPPGEPGGLSLFGRQASEHELLAEHVANSEHWVPTSGRGRSVHEWALRPGKPDNHWLDCLVGCAVAASMLGAATAAQRATTGQQAARHYTQADFNKLRRPR